MRTITANLAAAIFLGTLILMTPLPASGQQITDVTVEGTCREFTVSIEGGELGESCWDVKLDVPGRILMPGGSQSAFYYVEKGICYPEESATIQISLDTDDPMIDSTAKLRQGSRVIERDFTIVQDCPQPLPEYWVLLIAFAIILIFGWGLAWWWKQK